MEMRVVDGVSGEPLPGAETHNRSSGTRARTIGLVVDHPLRDLQGMVLLAHLLAQQGHTAILIPFYGLSFDLPLLDLDLLVLNYVRPANLRLVRAAQQRGIPLAVLDTEGGLMPQDGPTSPRGISEFLRQTGLENDLSLYMFWGPAFREVVVAQTSLPPDRAVVTGCPRFDLAYAPWAKRNAAAKIVLINTNFAGVNSAHATDGNIDKRALRSIGFDEAELDRMVAAAQGIMQRMIAALKQIVAARPSLHFVLRPHPFERVEPYRRHFSGAPNLDIRREGSVLDILSRSSCMLHVNCTTAIEAAVSGVPAISLEFANHPEMRRFAEVTGRISHRADSIEQVLDLIDRAADLGQAAGMDVIEPAFGPCDGRAAFRIKAAILEAASHPRRLSGQPPQPVMSRHRLLAWAGAVVGSATIEAARRKFHAARRDKALIEGDVRAILDRLADAQGVPRAGLSRLRARTGLPTMSLRVEPPQR